MNKKLYIITTVVVAVVLVSFWWWSTQNQTPVLDTVEIEQINQELEDLDLGDLNTEFEQIDQELETL